MASVCGCALDECYALCDGDKLRACVSWHVPTFSVGHVCEERCTRRIFIKTFFFLWELEIQASASSLVCL